MIKLSHTHPEGKVCYRVRSHHPLTEAGLFMSIDPLTLKPTTFACAYMGYTGHWYAWNVDTGRQIGSFTQEMYEVAIKHLRISDFVEDPECVV